MTAPDLHALIADMGKAARAASARMAAAPSAARNLALVALAQGLMPALLFVVAMLVGMLGYELWMQFNNSNRGGTPRPATGAH
jgi:hypothetical protein